jgi:enoyl-CoA hydratase
VSAAEALSTETAPPQGAVRLSIEGAVARVTFDRAHARNAMTFAMYEQLADACGEIAANRDVRVAVFRGSGGKAFVAGTDIEQFRAFSSGRDGVAYEHKVDTYVGALEALPVPSIAVVEGWAVGGGMALANACDFRVAAPGARFGVPIARTLGNCLSVASLRRLTDALGPALVKRMLLLAEMPTAEEMPKDYVTVTADVDALIEEMCGRLASHAPITLKATKEALRRLSLDPRAADSDLIDMVYGSADFREGVDAFLSKRSPEWTGG